MTVSNYISREDNNNKNNDERAVWHLWSEKKRWMRDSEDADHFSVSYVCLFHIIHNKTREYYENKGTERSSILMEHESESLAKDETVEGDEAGKKRPHY